jgi:hypothetical protein
MVMILSCAPSSHPPPSERGVRPDSAPSDQVVIVTGRVVDADTRAPVSHAQVDVPGLSASVAADSTGRFETRVLGPADCVRLRCGESATAGPTGRSIWPPPGASHWETYRFVPRPSPRMADALHHELPPEQSLKCSVGCRHRQEVREQLRF